MKCRNIFPGPPKSPISSHENRTTKPNIIYFQAFKQGTLIVSTTCSSGGVKYICALTFFFFCLPTKVAVTATKKQQQSSCFLLHLT